jgi:pimeloyl-ACP methyl ester carboxylesterase
MAARPAKRGGSSPKFVESYVTSFDGTRIYYSSIGKGFPIVCSDGIACDGFVWKYIVQQFSPHCRIIRYNYRGHGKSDKPADYRNLTVENCADDCAAVMEDAGIKSAVHLGHSMGVQVIFEIFRRHPDKVRGLVPMCGSYGHPLRTFHDSDLFDRVFPMVFDFITSRPSEVSMVLKKLLPTTFAFTIAGFTDINRHLVKQPDFMPYLEHVAVLDPVIFLTMLRFAKDHTARDVLPTINVPTLVYGAEHDTFTPVWLSRDMNRLIPGSEFQFLPLGTHCGPIEHADLVGLRLDQFMRDHFPGEYVSMNPATDVVKKGKKKAPAKRKARRPKVVAAVVEPVEKQEAAAK